MYNFVMRLFRKIIATTLCFCLLLAVCSCSVSGREYYCDFEVESIDVFVGESTNIFGLEHTSNVRDRALQLKSSDEINISGGEITVLTGGEYTICVCKGDKTLATITIRAFEIAADDSLTYSFDKNSFDGNDSYVVSIRKDGHSFSSYSFECSAQNVTITKVTSNLQIVCDEGQSFDITIKDAAAYKAIVLHFPL